MLTYAGQPLVVADKELRDKVEGLLATENLYEHARLHWNANEAFPTQLGVVVDHHIEIGKLFWPSGASRWAIGHFLVHQTEAEAIQEAVWGTAGTEYNSADLVMKWEEASYENGVESETDTVVDSITATLYAFPLRPISVDDEAGLYLLTLVDERFFWWSKNTGNLVATSSSTWSDVYTSFQTALGTTITPEAVDASYLAPGELVRLFYEPLPPWLDTVAWNVGQRIVVGLDGSVTAENPTVTAPSDTEGVLAGGEYLGSVDESNGPADGVGVFPDYSSGSFQGGYNAQTATGTGSEGTIVLRSPIKYTGSNGAALATLTQKFLDDFTTWQTGSQDVKLAGIVNVTPSGAYGNILWTYRRDELSTRVQPCDYPVRSFEPLTVNNVVSASICVSSCLRAYTDYGSNTYPVLGLGVSARLCSVSCVRASVDYPASSTSTGQLLHVFMGSKSCVTASHDNGSNTPSYGQYLHCFMGSKVCIKAEQGIPSLSGTANEIDVSYSNQVWTIGIVDPLIGSKGGTGQSTTTQGDLLYGSSSNTWSKLAKSGSSTRYLSNQGPGNDPSWSQVNLTNGVTGTLPVGNGGSGLTSYGTANQMLGMNSGASALEYKTFAVGTSGSDFNIAHSAGTVTWNLPDAGTAARGAVTTSTQIFGGSKSTIGSLAAWNTGAGERLTITAGASTGTIAFTVGGGLGTSQGTITIDNSGIIVDGGFASTLSRLQVADGSGPGHTGVYASDGLTLTNGSNSDSTNIRFNGVTLADGGSGYTGQTGTFLGLEFLRGWLVDGAGVVSPVETIAAGDDTIVIGGTATDPTVRVDPAQAELSLVPQAFGP